MAKQNYFLTIDTETTQDNLVADFGATITDKKGNIKNQCAILVNGIYGNESHPLFFDSSAPPNTLWSRAGADKREAKYNAMLLSGARMLASVAAVNKWLTRCKLEYNPILTAYNLPFDVNKCENTGIDLSIFDRRFCLWAAAYNKFAHTKKFRQLVLDSHAFNAPTDLGNMTFKTNAEIMARFVLNNPALPDEPHLAIEDIIGYELPILNTLLKTESVKKLLNPENGSYNWRDCQVKDWFTVK